MSSSPGTLIVVGANNVQVAKTVDYYDSNLKEWINAFTIDTDDRYAFNPIMLDGKLILLGGQNYKRTLMTTVTSYDFDTGETTELPSFLIKGTDLFVAVVSRHLYVMGGYSSIDYLSRVERYSPFTNTWESVEPMLKGRYHCGTSVLNGEIYVVGGIGPSALDDVEVYNPIYGKWRQCASMNEIRAGPAVAGMGGFMYAVGGSGRGTVSYTAERYDPVVDKWTYIENPVFQRRRGQAEVFNNAIIFAGGYNEYQKEIDNVESYDPDEGKWTVLPSLIQPRALFGLLKVPWLPST